MYELGYDLTFPNGYQMYDLIFQVFVGPFQGCPDPDIKIDRDSKIQGIFLWATLMSRHDFLLVLNTLTILTNTLERN